MSALAEPTHPLGLAPGSSANGSSSGVARPHTSSSDDDQPEDFDGGNESSDSDDGPTQDGPSNVASDAGGSRAAKRKRKNVSRACDRCRERKIKCSGECDGFAVCDAREGDASGLRLDKLSELRHDPGPGRACRIQFGRRMSQVDRSLTITQAMSRRARAATSRRSSACTVHTSTGA